MNEIWRRVAEGLVAVLLGASLIGLAYYGRGVVPQAAVEDVIKEMLKEAPRIIVVTIVFCVAMYFIAMRLLRDSGEGPEEQEEV